MAEKLKLGRKKDLQLHPSYYSQLPPWPPSPQAHPRLRLSPNPIPHMLEPPACTAPPKPIESPSRPYSPPGRLPTNSPLQLTCGFRDPDRQHLPTAPSPFITQHLSQLVVSSDLLGWEVKLESRAVQAAEHSEERQHPSSSSHWHQKSAFRQPKCLF